MRSARPGVVDGLGAVAAWRTGVEQEIGEQGERLDAALRTARERLREAEQALDDLERQRDTLSAKAAGLDAEETLRTREAVHSGLAVDEALIVLRSDALRRALHRQALAAAGLSALEAGNLDDLDRVVHRARPSEGRTQGRRGPGLAVAERLLPGLLAAEQSTFSLGAPAEAVAVVASMEFEQGVPTALELVLPLPWSVYAEPARHGDDLCARLAWRMVAALGGALRDVGAADAAVRPVSESGRLALQVWLADTDLSGSIKTALSEGFDRVHEQANELRAANLDLYLAWLDPDILGAPGVGFDA